MFATPQPAASRRVYPNKKDSHPAAGPLQGVGRDSIRAEAVIMKRLVVLLGALAFVFLVFPALNPSSGSAVSAMPGPHTYRLYCASDDFSRHFCPVYGSGGVELIRQRSESSCIYGRTWASPETAFGSTADAARILPLAQGNPLMA